MVSLYQVGRAIRDRRQRWKRKRQTRRVVVAAQHQSSQPVSFVVDSLFLAGAYKYCTSAGMSEVFTYVGGQPIATDRFMLTHLLPVVLAEHSVGGARADATSSIDVLEQLDCWGSPLVGHVHSHPGHGPSATHHSLTDRRFVDSLARGGYRVLGAIVARGKEEHEAYVGFYMHPGAQFSVTVTGHNIEPVEGKNDVYRLDLGYRNLPIHVPNFVGVRGSGRSGSSR